MSTLSTHHNAAMEFAQMAVSANLRGEADRAVELFRKAFSEELKAVEACDKEKAPEPTYSVIHRSAATLAWDCNDIVEAERLAKKALNADPPEEIADELRDLLGKIHARIRSKPIVVKQVVAHPSMPATIAPISAPVQCRFLITGVGNVVSKLEQTWKAFEERGIEMHAADIVGNPIGRKALPKGTSFYNWKNPDDFQRLVSVGLRHPFDVAYISTYPSIHIATAIRLDFIARQFIFPAPVDTHFDLLETMHREHVEEGVFKDLMTRSYVHDHYRNKPVAAFLRGHIQDLHKKHGYLKIIRFFITEHKTIQMDFSRRESLECGMILDLAPHALSVIFEIVPAQLTWLDNEGNTFQRTDRTFQVVSTVRARDNNSILHGANVETFAALHLRVSEEISFIPKADPQRIDRLARQFNILIVVGKGVSVQDEGSERDLKAIELEFEGQIVLANFDTNALSGAIDHSLRPSFETEIDWRHRGLNLPLQQLLKNGFQVHGTQSGTEISLFQSFEHAFAIAKLLEECRTHLTAQGLLRYVPLEKVASLVNRCVSKGLDSMWILDSDPTQLLFGDLPTNSIP